MKKLKIVLWALIIGFIAIIFFSNKDYLLAKQVFQIDLMYGEPFHTMELPNAIFFLVFFSNRVFDCLFYQSFRTVQIEKNNKEFKRSSHFPAGRNCSSQKRGGIITKRFFGP